MEDSSYSPSTLPAAQTTAESCYVPSSAWMSNIQQLSQISAMQFASGNGQLLTGPHILSSHGQVLTGAHIPSRSQIESVRESNPGAGGEPAGAGLAVPFQHNPASKRDFVPNPAVQSSLKHAVGKCLQTSVNVSHPGSLHQASGNVSVDAANLSESLQKIEHLALNTSLSLDACCSPESKPTTASRLSAGIKLPPESSSSIGPDKNKTVTKALPCDTNEELFSQSGSPPASSCCECNEPVNLNAPGTELSLAIASVVDNGNDHADDPHSFISSWTNNPQAVGGSSSIDKGVSRKDEMFFRLVQQVRELEVQLQERKEWAHQKALQAAYKFSKDMSELKSLRLEHEEILCLKRDTQALEDNTVKRLTEMEAALRKAGAQVDKANGLVRKLETEKAELKAEMEAAKLSASESNAKCQEVAKREKKSSKKIQAWEKQKAKMQEEIVKQKQEIAQAQEKLSTIKIQQHEAEVRWRQEEKAKEDALSLANAEKWAREQLEAAAKRKEESWRRKADADFQRHKDDIQRLESELDQLKMAAETRSVEAASSPGGAGTAGGHGGGAAADASGLQALKETCTQLLQELAELQDSRDICRDRECVMCMSEESSVVFLPCAHQIVCAHCNETHQKQGMRDCPSCRTIIEQRIHVSGGTPM